MNARVITVPADYESLFSWLLSSRLVQITVGNCSLPHFIFPAKVYVYCSVYHAFPFFPCIFSLSQFPPILFCLPFSTLLLILRLLTYSSLEGLFKPDYRPQSKEYLSTNNPRSAPLPQDSDPEIFHNTYGNHQPTIGFWLDNCLKTAFMTHSLYYFNYLSQFSIECSREEESPMCKILCHPQ